MKGVLLKGQSEVPGELNDETEEKLFEACSGIYRKKREQATHGNDLRVHESMSKYKNTINIQYKCVSGCSNWLMMKSLLSKYDSHSMGHPKIHRQALSPYIYFSALLAYFMD